jgi:hypothetical protein
MINIFGIDPFQEENDSNTSNGTNDKETSNVGIQGESNQGTLVISRRAMTGNVVRLRLLVLAWKLGSFGSLFSSLRFTYPTTQ